MLRGPSNPERVGTQEDRVTIAFRGSREYREKLQRAALDHGQKVQTFLREAADRHLDYTYQKDLVVGQGERL